MKEISILDKAVQAEVIRLIESAEHPLIISHKNPDGDAVGSSLGLKFFLKKLGKQPNIILPDSFPEFLNFLPGSSNIKFFDRQRETCIKILNEADLIFFLDFNSLKRIDELGKLAGEKQVAKIMIDHHPFPDEIADYKYHRTNVSSTSELVYEFCRMLYPQVTVQAKMATNLYAGLSTDTGTFRHNIHENTHQTAGALFKAGADHAAVIQNIFDSNSVDRMRLMGFCLFEKLTIIPEAEAAYIALSKEEMTAFHHRKGDTEGFVNQALSIDEVKMAVLFTEQSDVLTKLSFRSKGDFAINDFANKYFNGGGHKNAAGGIYEGNMSKAVEYFLEKLPEVKVMNGLTI
jgi:phosphoesterase RecJ-like protein